jgi:hypothetical protein
MAGRSSQKRRGAKRTQRKPQTQKAARSRGTRRGASGRARSSGQPKGGSTRSVREAESRRRPVSKRRSPKELGARERSRRNIDIGRDDRNGLRERDVERERYEGSATGNRDVERDPAG